MSKFILLLFMIAVLIGCTTKVQLDNQPPILNDVGTGLTVKKDSSITITFEHLSATDNEGDTLSIVLDPEGENYTVSKTTVTPNSGHIGDIYVGLQVWDGEFTSKKDSIIILVEEN